MTSRVVEFNFLFHALLIVTFKSNGLMSLRDKNVVEI